MSALPPGGLPPYTNPTLVAFGSIATAGYTPFTAPITGDAAVFLWGRWAWLLPLYAERSTDNGATWRECSRFSLDPPGSGVSYAYFSLNRGLDQTGTAIYHLGLAAEGMHRAA